MNHKRTSSQSLKIEKIVQSDDSFEESLKNNSDTINLEKFLCFLKIEKQLVSEKDKEIINEFQKKQLEIKTKIQKKDLYSKIQSNTSKNDKIIPNLVIGKPIIFKNVLEKEIKINFDKKSEFQFKEETLIENKIKINSNEKIKNLKKTIIELSPIERKKLLLNKFEQDLNSTDKKVEIECNESQLCSFEINKISFIENSKVELKTNNHKDKKLVNNHKSKILPNKEQLYLKSKSLKMRSPENLKTQIDNWTPIEPKNKSIRNSKSIILLKNIGDTVYRKYKGRESFEIPKSKKDIKVETLKIIKSKKNQKNTRIIEVIKKSTKKIINRTLEEHFTKSKYSKSKEIVQTKKKQNPDFIAKLKKYLLNDSENSDKMAHKLTHNTQEINNSNDKKLKNQIIKGENLNNYLLENKNEKKTEKILKTKSNKKELSFDRLNKISKFKDRTNSKLYLNSNPLKKNIKHSSLIENIEQIIHQMDNLDSYFES